MPYKHTPPPWKVGQAFWTETGDVAYVLEGVKEACAPDCSLIGAAPEMVEALEVVAVYADRLPDWVGDYIFDALAKAAGDPVALARRNMPCVFCGDEVEPEGPLMRTLEYNYHESCLDFVGFDVFTNSPAKILQNLAWENRRMSLYEKVRSHSVFGRRPVASVIPDPERVTESLGEAMEHVDHAIREIGYFAKPSAELAELKAPIEKIYADLLQASGDLSNLLDE